MSPEPIRDVLRYGTVDIPVTTVFADRATLEIGVEPDGSVLVKAPAGAPYARVRARVRQKARWIERQRAFFRGLPRPAPREYVSGETHHYLGRGYRLKVERAPRTEVKLLGRHLVARTPDGSPERTARALDRWYRARATAKFAERLDVVLPRFTPHGVTRPELRIRAMSTRWGSRTAAGTVLLNPALVRAPVPCVDYVLAHELAHALRPHHGPTFYDLLDATLPDWRRRRDRLNGADW